VQELLPVPEAEDPAGQAVQVELEVAPVAEEYVPAAQPVQELFPVPDAYVPAEQAVQDSAVPPAEYVPAPQSTQDPAARRCPAGQLFAEHWLRQADEPPQSFSGASAGQFEQDEAPASEYFPDPQGEQELLPVPDAEVPAEQVEQELLPVPDAYCPVGQGEQDVLPVLEVYCPAGQGVHSVAVVVLE